MNYRHGYHAGNFADVVKHIALVAILLHLKKKDAGFAVVDSHAGRGAYDLSGTEAVKTGEAAAGIGKLRDLGGVMPEALSSYLALAKEKDGRYPGSPLIAAKLLRVQDRLTAIEKHRQEFGALEDLLTPFANARVEQDDGYRRAVKLVPPPSRRGLILLDPPFEAPDEFARLAQTVREAWRKFATGIYLAWYPIKSQAEANGFTGEVLAAGIQKALVVEAQIAAAEGKLGRAGLLVINPPYGFEEAMRQSAGLIGPPMGAQITSRWLAGRQ
jgi:23S rRNA (adenine2030-N6)-methyltransferase